MFIPYRCPPSSPTTIKISLFYPSQKSNLYFDKNNKSTIDFFNSDYDKFPNLNKVKYIEVLLHKDQMISIPYKWIYLLSKYEDDKYSTHPSRDKRFAAIERGYNKSKTKLISINNSG